MGPEFGRKILQALLTEQRPILKQDQRFSGGQNKPVNFQKLLAEFEQDHAGGSTMEDTLVPISLFLAIAWVIKTMSDNRVKRTLVAKEKVDPALVSLLQNSGDPRIPAALKWGLVLLGIGLGLIVGQRYSEEIKIAMIFIFGGLALVLYYILASTLLRRENPEQTQS